MGQYRFLRLMLNRLLMNVGMTELIPSFAINSQLEMKAYFHALVIV